jgi:N-acetylglucosaminyldiphosphoundecaprenol N-acetyl-beta-D-mannosaminyltransferase
MVCKQTYSLVNHSLFGIPFYRKSKEELLKHLEEWVLNKDNPFALLTTANVDHLVNLERRDRNFKPDYLKAKWITADGMPIKLTSFLVGQPVPRITGADLLIDLLVIANNNNLTVGIIFPSSIIRYLTTKHLNHHYTNIKLLSYVAPKDFNNDQLAHLQARSALYSADILIVGLGFPTQEKWLLESGPYTDAGVGIGVGAGLEFLVGTKKRSPVWLQNLGFEWLHRAVTDRRLIKRYVKDIYYFTPLFIKEIWSSFLK